MAVPFDQPLCVVKLGENGHPLAEVVDVLVEPSPQALLLQGADEALGAAVAFRLPRVAGIVSDSQPGEAAGEMVGAVLASPVMTHRHPSGHVGGELAEAIDEDRKSTRLNSTHR